MADLESIERRLERIEQRVNEVASASGKETGVLPKRAPGRTSRVIWGIFIIAIGLIWLAQRMEVQWVQDVAIWPLALIAFGLFLIFGGRGR